MKTNEKGNNGSITLAGQTYSFEAFSRLHLPDDCQWAGKSQAFIKDWLSDKSLFELHTSGSTGQPKPILLRREQLRSSALATIRALSLTPNTHGLVAMDTAFIGGKMMLVRGIIGEWHLHLLPPSAYPLPESTSIAFTALVPMQVESLLKTKEGLSFLNNLSQLIIGGADILPVLQAQIKRLKCQVWHTFGMTETVSHIALKPLNGEKASSTFKVIGDNEIALNDEGCLRIRGTVTEGQWIDTHDMAQIVEDGFIWLGRNDLTINSGGVKINIETAENDIRQKLLQGQPIHIALWKLPHPHLGEELVGLATDSDICRAWTNQYSQLKKSFQKYHFPKRWFYVNQLHLTSSGKLDRRSTLTLASEVDVL